MSLGIGNLLVSPVLTVLAVSGGKKFRKVNKTEFYNLTIRVGESSHSPEAPEGVPEGLLPGRQREDTPQKTQLGCLRHTTFQIPGLFLPFRL